MSISRLFQILLARRYFIAICAISCLVGVIIVSLIVPPIWQGHARVLLNGMKPDPVTGETASGGNGAAAMAFESTQINLITDYVVTSKVVDALGWASDPNLLDQYQGRSSQDRRDFRSWAADLIAQNTTVKPVKDSTMLDITYNASSATAARAVAEMLQKAYVQTTLDMHTADAARTANWYEGELQKLRAKLDEAVQAESTYERQNGIVMTSEKIDVDSERLQSLAGQGQPLVLPPPLADAAKQSGMELASVNAQIVSASKTLGPNNPQMQELMRRKSGLEALVAKDETAARAANAAAATGGGVSARQLAAQKTRVIANSDKLGHLQTLQQDVDVRRNDYQTAAMKFAQFRTQGEQDTAQGLTALPVETPKQPLFPNWLLEIPGSIVLGGMIGVLLVLLIELLNRRVRAVEDLDEDLQLPVIGVIAAPAREGRARPRFGRLGRPSTARVANA
jgi:uncharacterized protein involved in exopolysaccharide biosynthesis